MIGKITKQEIYNDLYNKHLTWLVIATIDIKLFESFDLNEVVAERAGPIKGSKIPIMAEEALKEAKKKLKDHMKILEIIKEIERPVADVGGSFGGAGGGGGG